MHWPARTGMLGAMSRMPPPAPLPAPMPDPMPATPTGIEVTAEFFALAFILFLCPVIVEINGVPHRVKWGKNFFPALPGGYTVGVAFSYLWMSRCGRNQVNVWVHPGLISRVSYYAPFLMTMAGSISVR